MEEIGIRVTANDDFKRASTNWTQIGLLAAVGIHFGLFVFVRPFEAADLGVVADEIEAINLPPEVKIPPPPEAIARPARPRVSALQDISEEITIAPTTFESVSTEALPPPPAGGSPADRPSFIPYSTPPVLLNAAEVRAAVDRAYPKALKDAGITGTVELHVYVDEQGVPRNHEVRVTSGNALLDQAAAQAVQVMRFSPAKNRDVVTDVWITQRITFELT